MSESELVPVVLNDEDTVYLRPRLGLAAGIAVQKLIVDANTADTPVSAAELTGVLAEAYLLHGVAAWSFPDPVNPVTIHARLLSDFEVGAPVAEKADELYMQSVLAPLLKKASNSLRATSSNGSTSARGNGAQRAKKPSKRSSTTTTPTGVIETTSE